MVAVRRPGQGSVVGAHIFSGDQAGAVGEDDIVLGEALLGRGGGGDDEDTAGAELEEHHRAVEVGDLG